MAYSQWSINICWIHGGMWIESHLDWSQWGWRQGTGAGAGRFSPGQASAALLRRGIQGGVALRGARALGDRGRAAACGAWARLWAGRAVGEHILLPDVRGLEDAVPYGCVRRGIRSGVRDWVCQSISTYGEAVEQIPALASPTAHFYSNTHTHTQPDTHSALSPQQPTGWTALLTQCLFSAALRCQWAPCQGWWQMVLPLGMGTPSRPSSASQALGPGEE